MSARPRGHRNSLRRRLVVAIVAVHAVLMGLFLVDLSLRQRQFLRSGFDDEALALSRSLAASALSWVVANDSRGLAETIEGVKFPGLLEVMVLSPERKVLAHSDPARVGSWLTDDLPARDEAALLPASETVIDAIAPIVGSSGRAYGFVRVRLSTESADRAFADVVRRGLFYALLAVGLGMALAVLIARRLSRDIENLADVAERITAGETVRNDVDRDDELGALARQLNTMLDALHAKSEALREAQLTAERANQARAEFLATISHEIRTPLNGVTGMAQALTSERDPRRVAEGLDIVRASSETLLAVINDVLDLSKMEANKLVLERVPMSPAAQADHVVHLMQAAAEQHGTRLELALGDDVPPWLLGDPLRYRQVLQNLVSNAVKFTERGAVTVRLRRQGGQLETSVTDTGIGMSADVVARLFTPFTQADASTTRRFGGSGLGLAICHRLTEAMQGRISVDSAPGRGTTFTVLLPCEVAQPPAAEHVLPPVPTRDVLLVEDNHINRVVVTRILEQLGQRVTVANDGVEALAACSGREFDLVLMDCHMPNLDGYEATKSLRQRGYKGSIVALTASAAHEDNTRCLALGMNRVLHKPVQVRELAEVLSGLDVSAVDRVA